MLFANEDRKDVSQTEFTHVFAFSPLYSRPLVSKIQIREAGDRLGVFSERCPPEIRLAERRLVPPFLVVRKLSVSVSIKKKIAVGRVGPSELGGIPCH